MSSRCQAPEHIELAGQYYVVESIAPGRASSST
jgi:hypothetical protein